MPVAGWCFLALVMALAAFDGVMMAKRRAATERYMRTIRGKK